ncbi:MAG: hypothetical protein R2867_26235 [Caldilineaceae bacterium]
MGTEAYFGHGPQPRFGAAPRTFVDYASTDGCNACHYGSFARQRRGQCAYQTEATTYVPGIPVSLARGTSAGAIRYQEALQRNPVIFETMSEVSIFPEHNSMPIYTWGDEDRCLPAGATTATLQAYFQSRH